MTKLRVWFDDVVRWHLTGLLPVRNARFRELQAEVETLEQRLSALDRYLVALDRHLVT